MGEQRFQSPFFWFVPFVAMTLGLLFAFALSAGAMDIIWVTEVAGDSGYTDVLTAAGHNVTRAQGTTYQTLDAGKIAALNAADLVIVSRNTNSGAYDDGSEIGQWNGITSPLILMSSYLVRSSRWKWINSGTIAGSSSNHRIVLAADAAYAGLGVSNDDSVGVYTASADGIGTSSSGNGTLIAKTDNANQYVWLARWAAGTEYYSGSGQTCAGDRVFFPGVNGSYAFTAFGEDVFLNLVGDFEQPVIDNSTGATPGVGFATLYGMLTHGCTAQVEIYWGTTDGGTTKANWDHVTTLDWQRGGEEFTAIVTAGYPETYHYRCYATNAAGHAWASASTNFTTLDPGVSYPISYARIDIGPNGQRVEPGGWQSLGAAAANNGNNGTEVVGLGLTSDTGDAFTFSMDDTTTAGGDQGAIDWRDRGDASTPEALVRIGEDFVKNNSGIVRVTLGNMPSGDYDVISYHVDTGNTQSDQIEVKVSTDGGTSYSGVLGTGDAGAQYNNDVNNLTTVAMTNSQAEFSFTATGTDDVMIVFDGSPSSDSETPLNGLDISTFQTYDLALTNNPVSSITTNAATLHGALMATGYVFDVYVYWGTNDEGTVAGNWDTNAFVGSFTNRADAISYRATGLTEFTDYACAFLATNDVTNVWATPSMPFQTLGTVVVTNNPVTDVSAVLATLNGEILSGGGGDLTIYWGTTDPGMTASGWDHTNHFGERIVGIWSTTVTVRASSRYYYRTYATNVVSHDWGDPAETFTTPEPAATLSLAGSPFDETGGQATVTAALNAPSASNVTVNLAFSGGAVRDTDYSVSATSVVIPAGSLSSNITLTALDDADQEEDESAIVAIDTLVNATSGTPSSVTATLSSDDPEVTNGDATGVDENSATLNGVLTMGDGATAKILWGDDDGGTTMGNWDETNTVGAVTEDNAFTSPVSSLTANKTYYYRCYATNGSSRGEDWADPTASFITGPPSVSIDDVAVTEGDSGEVDAVFTVTLSTLSATDVSVDYATADGTAAADADYTIAGDTLTIPAGQPSGTITIKVRGDTEFEYPSQGFAVNLTNPTACTIADSEGTGTINDDDTAGHLEAWRHRMKISFDGYAGGGTLTNWPALVRLSTNIVNFDYGTFASTNAGDLRFADSNLTRMLSFEIEEWDADDESCVWVQVPELEAGGGFIWMYWNNPDETNLPSYATDGSTWSADYLAVYHLHDNANDSTPNGYHLTPIDAPPSASGVIADADDFDGAADRYENTAIAAAINGLTYATVTTWLQSDSANADRGFFCWTDDTQGDQTFSGRYDAAGGSGGQPSVIKASIGGSTLESSGNAQTTDWQFIAQRHRSGQVLQLYVDGLLDTPSWTQGTGSAISGVGKLVVGDGAKNEWDGRVDEFRISTVARTPDWIQAGYSNQCAGSTFNTYGTVRGRPVIAIIDGATNRTIDSAYLTATLTATGTAETAVWVFWGTNDGGRVQTDWDNTQAFGTVSGPLPVDYSTNVTSLSDSTQYFYSYLASNTYAMSWASSSFYTLGRPAVENTGATSYIGYATLSGNVVSTGGAPTTVYTYWGDNDGGTNGLLDWDHVITNGVFGEKSFSSNTPAALSYGLTYYYRCFASNSNGTAWAPSTTSFLTVVPFERVPTSYAKIDIGPAGQRVDAGDGWQIMPGGAANNNSGAEVSGQPMTSDTGDAFTISLDDTDTGGADVGRIDWRDRGDSAADPALGRVAEDFVKNNNGIVRITLGSIPADEYAVTSYHADPMVSQSGQIDVRTSTDGGASFSGVLDSGSAIFSYDGVDGPNFTTANIDSSKAEFSFTANGTDDVVILFDGRPHSDDETPVNGLDISGTVPVLFVGITNTAATNLEDVSGTLTATLSGTDSVFHVYAYWSTNDGGTVAGAWDTNAYVGSYTNEVSSDLTHDVSLLTRDTVYFYTFMATNDATNIWAQPSMSFRTMGSVTISNAAPTDVTSTSTTMNGTFVAGVRGLVGIYWGPDDGVTDKLAWSNRADLGTVYAPSSFSTNMTGLLANGTYYYRCYVTNAYCDGWAGATTNFTTEVTSVSISDVTVTEGDSGTTDAAFTVTLAATSATDVSVNYATADGTATAGLDYMATNGTLVVPAGQVSAQIVVKLSGDSHFDPSETFVVNLSNPGDCTVTDTQATCTIIDDDADDYLEGWWYRVRIDLDGYSGGETLTNWPALVRLSTNITGFTYSNFVSGVGGDLRFANADVTRLLNFEIEEWDTNDVSSVWVQVRELPPGGTSIWAYWRHPTETNLPSCTTNGATWSDDFAGVWHLHEDVADESTGGTHYDSTANENDGTQNNNAEVAGAIARGQVFDGSGDYVDCGNDSSLNLNHLSVSAWVKTTTAGTWFRTIVAKFGYSSITESWGLGWDSGNALCFFVRDSGNNRVLVKGANGWGTDDQWHHLAGTRGDGKVRFYGDGVLLHQLDDTIADIRNTRPVSMARHGGTYVNESIDEVRISSGARSAAWIAASYSNQVVGSTFATYGDAEWLALPSITLPGAQNLTGNNADLVASVVSTGKAPTYVWAYWGRTNEGSNASAWAENDSHGLIAAVPPVELTTHAAGLLSTTQYFYAYQASNSFGQVWASTDFTTLEAPAVDNSSGAVVGVGAATLNGQLTAGTLANAYICWGLAPGGADTGSWEHVESVGEVGMGVFSTDVTAYHGMTYSYRCFVTNAVGYGWSPAASTFATLAPALTVTSSYARIDIGPNGQRVDAADGWQILPGAANVDANGPEVSGQVMTSDAGDVFTVSLDDTDTVGADRGGIDWRDRGNSSVDPTLGRVAEDFVKNNSGIVRLTLGSIPAGDYNVVSYHVDPANTQSGQIDVRASTDGGSSYSAVLDSGDASFAYGGVNGASFTTVNISNSAAMFSFTATGSDDVRLVFDGTPHSDDETPLNGLDISALLTYDLEIANDPVSNLSTNSATLNGSLVAKGQVFDVYAFWGTTDGGAVAANWETNALVGRFEDVVPGDLQFVASGLTETTEYFCTFMATNELTNVWASPSQSFTTPGLLLVSNMAPSGVTATSVTMRARVAEGGTAEAALYWGPSDGGEVHSAWANTSLYGMVVAPIDLTTNLAGLLANQIYYYRAYATNAAGEDWADVSTSFTTDLPELSIDDVAVDEGDSGTTVASFAVVLSDVSGSAASVLFSADGDTATAGSDYATAGGTLVIPAGTLTGRIDVVVNGDNVGEWPSESFYVNLSGAAGCTITDAQGLGTITDDDLPEFLSSFPCKLRITFTNYTRPGVLNNFPALVRLSESITGFDYRDFRSGVSDDLRFSDDAGTQVLNHEIEDWDVTGTSPVWVQVPAFSNNCSIWAYWGRSGLRAPASASDGATWSEGYEAVWHLSEANVQDSSSNAIHGVSHGNTDATGNIDGGQDFDAGANAHVDCGNPPQLDRGTDDWTVSAWVKTTAGGRNNIFSNGGDGGGGIRYMLNTGEVGDGRITLTADDNVTKEQATSSTDIRDGDWHHVVGLRDGTTMRIYIDGAPDGTNPVASNYDLSGTSQKNAYVGAGAIQSSGALDKYFDGVIDEVRISREARSADWVWACWMNQRTDGVPFETYSEVIAPPTLFIVK